MVVEITNSGIAGVYLWSGWEINRLQGQTGNWVHHPSNVESETSVFSLGEWSPFLFSDWE